jgi:hypothetical protein
MFRSPRLRSVLVTLFALVPAALLLALAGGWRNGTS